MIIALVGNTGAGKSTLSRLLKKALGARTVTIGYTLLANAKKLGIPVKDYLKMIESNHGLSAHVMVLKEVIEKKLKKHQTVIVEGTYKMADILTLKKLFPGQNVFIFYVEAPESIRIKRLMLRKKVGKSEAERWVQTEDKERREVFKMEEVARISDGKIINVGLTKKQLFAAFSNQFRVATIKRVVSSKSRKIK